jgi:predicted PurR-regulated permease PerM
MLHAQKRRRMKFRLSSLLIFVAIVAVTVGLIWQIALLRDEITSVRNEITSVRNESKTTRIEISRIRDEVVDANRQFQLGMNETTGEMERRQRRIERAARNSAR